MNSDQLLAGTGFVIVPPAGFQTWNWTPAVLITNSEKLARDTMNEVERLLTILPTADAAGQAWKDCGEVIVCDSYDNLVEHFCGPTNQIEVA